MSLGFVNFLLNRDFLSPFPLITFLYQDFTLDIMISQENKCSTVLEHLANKYKLKNSVKVGSIKSYFLISSDIFFQMEDINHIEQLSSGTLYV